MTDNSPSSSIAVLLLSSHIFRMSLFFFVAGFFARMLFQRGGARGFWANRAQAHPAAAGRRLGRALSSHRHRVDVGDHEDVRRHAAAGARNLPPAPPRAFPLTHLWFLYYLLVLYAALLLGRRS